MGVLRESLDADKLKISLLDGKGNEVPVVPVIDGHVCVARSRGGNRAAFGG